MAEYKGIHGTKIQNYTTDPDNPITGQVWYNETSQTMKFQYPTTIAAWSTGGNLNTARMALAGAGTQTSALGFGGDTGSLTNATESYDGTSWTTLNNLNTTRAYLAASGTDNTSALAFGGAVTPNTFTESWNGTSWTEVNDMNIGSDAFAGTGTQTAALGFGGPTPVSSATEEWNQGPFTKTITSS